MKTGVQEAERIRKYAGQMGGVFSKGDLRNLFGQTNEVLLHRRIAFFIEAGILTRFCRGFYVSSGYDPEVLAARVIEDSYLSLGTVLAKELMIGSIPAKSLYAVRVGRNRIFRGPDLTLEYVGLDASLYFGYRTRQAIRFATPEKALLDTLYFYLRGRRYSFDIYQDIDISRVNLDLMGEWLGKYRNPRFVSFVKGYLNDRR